MTDSHPGFCADSQLVGPTGAALVSTFQNWGFANLVPVNATIEVTLSCNIRCLHCYNFDRDGHAPANARPALTDDEILALMTELRAAGCLFLSLTGGEVFTHPSLFRFLDHARELNLAVQLLSNGTLLRPGVAARLREYPNLMGTSLSLYGATAGVHDLITQREGSFRRTWEGAARLRRLGMAVRLKFIVMRQNVGEVAAMMAMADQQGFPYMIDLTVTARHDGTTGSLATRVGRADLEALYRGPLRGMIPTGKRPFSEEQLPCNCARGNCAITATGDVLPCISVPLPAGNIRDQPFAAIWKESAVFQQIRGLQLKDYDQCAPCGHKGFCSRNRGAAFTASGSYTGVDPFVCAGAEVAHRIADESQGIPAEANPQRP